MQLGFVKRVRESFSAKIIMLVASSVIMTSFVVGLTTTRSTGKFLTDQMKDRFPSMLTTTTTRLRLWSDRRRNDAVEISNLAARHIHALRARLSSPSAIVTANRAYVLDPVVTVGRVRRRPGSHLRQPPVSAIAKADPRE